jgi:hypothetical protein
MYHNNSRKTGATQEFMIYEKEKCMTVTIDVVPSESPSEQN